MIYNAVLGRGQLKRFRRCRFESNNVAPRCDVKIELRLVIKKPGNDYARSMPRMTTSSNDMATRLTSWFLRKTSVSAVRRIAAFPAALSSDVGTKRDENQDRVAIVRGSDFFGRPYLLAALSDGIGGMNEGSTCAAATLGHLFSSFFEFSRSDNGPDFCLTRAAQAANTAVHQRFFGKGGATLSTLLVTHSGKVFLLNVGDSRIYRVTGDQLVQLTVDDTIAGQLGRKVETDIGANLLQFIGIGKSLEASAVPMEATPNEAILLTSDGIHYLDKNLLGGLIHHAADLGSALKRITETAKWLGGHDNGSAVMLVPRLAVREPNPNGNIDTIEIWDPFGELQLVLPRSQFVKFDFGDRPQERPFTAVTGEVPPLMTSAASPTGATKAIKTKKRRDRKPRTPTQKNINERAKVGREKSKAPQLRIDFPKKG
jgi:PPM family protein phosphatase